MSVETKSFAVLFRFWYFSVQYASSLLLSAALSAIPCCRCRCARRRPFSFRHATLWETPALIALWYLASCQLWSVWFSLVSNTTGLALAFASCSFTYFFVSAIFFSRFSIFSFKSFSVDSSSASSRYWISLFLSTDIFPISINSMDRCINTEVTGVTALPETGKTASGASVLPVAVSFSFGVDVSSTSAFFLVSSIMASSSIVSSPGTSPPSSMSRASFKVWRILSRASGSPVVSVSRKYT